MKKIHLLICCILAVCALFCSSVTQGQVITTVAGSTIPMGPPAPPTEGVAATASTLNEPYGMAQDAAGNVYFADYQNNLIRKISTTGIISIVAGNGTRGYAGDGGLANAATCELNQPKGVALDAAGNIYITDYGNDRVRMVAIGTGIISTIAGTGSPAAPYGDIGPASAAHINPNGIVVGLGSTPVIYVSDGTMGNYVVHAIAYVPLISGYGIYTVAGSGAAGTPPWGDGGAATASNLDAPRGLALNAAGDTLYIADMTHNLIRMVNLTGTPANIYTVVGNDMAGPPAYGAGDAGNGGVATATACKISAPTGVAVDAAGDLYVTDVGSNMGMTATYNDIRYVDALTGIISTIVDASGTTGPSPYGDGGSALAANLYAPVSVLLDNTTPGNYYIADEDDDRIRYVNISAVAAGAISFTGGATQSLTVCENSTATSINSLLQVAEGTSGLTLNWSPLGTPASGTLVASYSTTSTGSSITPAGLTYTPNPGFSGTDHFSVQVTNGTSTASTTINVTVNPIPPVDPIGGTVTSVCVGSNITLTDLSTGGVWATANANASVAGGNVTGRAGGADDIYYIVSNACGPDTARLSITIDPGVTPLVNISSTLGTTTCGVPGTFTAVTINGGPSPVYQWSVNGTAILGATLPSYTYTPVSGDVVSVQLTSDAPCTIITTAGSSITMSGGASIIPAISISTGVGDTVCVGVPVTVTSAITNGGTSPTYSWTLNGAPSGSGSTFPYVATPSSDGDVIVCTLTSSIPCAIPSTAVSNAITIHLRSATTASVSITASPGNTVCTGTAITFTSVPVGGGSDPFLRWSRAGINVATGPYYICTPDSGDVVYCTMRSSIACSVTDTENSNAITMRVSTPVTPVVNIVSNYTTVGVDKSVTFHAFVTSNTPTPVYQWYVNGVAVPGAVASVYVYTGNMDGTSSVSCTVGSGDGCNTSGTSNIISVTFSDAGVSPLASSSTALKLVPNPNKGAFSMTLVSGNNEQADVVITNILGQKVKAFSMATNNTTEISLDEAPGIYIISATTSEGKTEAKVVIN